MGYFIKSYKEYIDKYITFENNKKFKKIPGEHHFVSLYLLERVIEIKGNPDYINPDGMKDVPGGDLVWFDDSGKYQFGIEVKMNDAKLSKQEYIKWFMKHLNAGNYDSLKEDYTKGDSPDLMIGISSNGFFMLEWKNFVEKYSDKIKNNTKWIDSLKKYGNKDHKKLRSYSPAFNIHNFIEDYKGEAGFFHHHMKNGEQKFMKKLREYLG